MSAFPDMQVLMDDLQLEGDGAVYRWTLVGTNTGPGGTGRACASAGSRSGAMGADGLIVESRGHFDSDDYQRQLNAE